VKTEAFCCPKADFVLAIQRRAMLESAFMGIRRRKRIVLTSLFLLIAIVAAGEARAAATRPLRIAFLFTSGTMASVWMAKETGGFAKEGLDVEMISMGSTLALPALLANEVDVIQVSAAPVITASLRGFDVVFIAGMLNTMIWDLYARPEIKSAEQLRGKIVGTDRPGSPVAYGTLVALRKLGLTGRDVQLRPFGGSIQIAAALQSGQITAGAAGPPLSFHVERNGFHSMVSTLDQPYQNVGLVVRRGRMNELAPRLVSLLRAVRGGIDRYYADKAFTLKVIPKYTRDTDPDIIDRTYEFYRKAGFHRELMISEPGMRGILDFLSETIPEAKKAVPAQFFDDRFVRQLDSGK
jgi:ABC-type nitrate/sulfonate/bicarbonate transport system substrate-binding protein